MSVSEGTRLEGRTAIITGAAQGLGFAIARRFVDEGARVLLTDIQDERGASAAENLGQGTGKAMFQHLDVASEEDWGLALTRCKAEFGSPDILVNNAYMWCPEPLLELDLPKWEQSLRVNLTSAFLGMKAVIPGMLEAGGGSIVNVGSSLGGEVGSPVFGGYQAAKGGLRALTRHVAVTYGKDGVRANLLHCGPMMTDGMVEAGWASHMEETAKRFPIPRVGDPNEVAWAAVFLASGESSYITGTALIPDGGSSIAL